MNLEFEEFERYEMPFNPMLKVGAIVDSKYRILKELGEGSFGIVYQVEDTEHGDVYALKLLKLWRTSGEKERKLMLKRFGREYRCGQIDSPYLVHSVAYGKEQGNPYIVMEFCANGNLADHVGKAYDIQWVNTIAFQILTGLKALHREGKFHRDIKPENILFGRDNTVKLTDFGIAGFQNERMTLVTFSGRAKEIFGTYAYIAPEQYNRDKAYKSMNAVTDIYSFGVSMYELLTNVYPYGPLKSDSDLVTYLNRSKEGKWDDIRRYRPDLPDIWVQIIDKCLEPDYKAKRFKSVDEIIDLLGYSQEPELTISYNSYRDFYALEIMDGEENGKIYNLSKMMPNDEGILTLGWYDPSRPEKNDVGIKETLTEYVSNFHATIEKTSIPERWYIRDGQWRQKQGRWDWHPSLNGVWVNSREVGTEGIMLSPNDIITIGDTTLKVIIIKG